MLKRTRHIRLGMLFLASLLGTSLSLKAQDQTTATTPADQNTIQCVQTADIEGYEVISDELVRFIMNGPADIQMRFKRHCPQLYFHKYVSYTPVNGKLCARFDNITTRSGTPCRIASFSEIGKKPE